MDALGGILTKGLGADMSAMILGQFRLKILSIVVVAPPTGGGGVSGGSVPTTSSQLYLPYTKHLSQTTRHVIVTVQFSEDRTWKKHYAVDRDKAEIIIKVINFFNAVKGKVAISVGKIRGTSKKVFAVFKDDNK